MTLEEQIVVEARKMLGTPFRHAGREPGQGVDCVGVLIVVGNNLGLFDYDYRNYSRQVDANFLRSQIERFGYEVDRNLLRPADVLLFNVAGYPQHTGLYTGGFFVHAFEEEKRVVETRWNRVWEKNLNAVFRFKGLK